MTVGELVYQTAIKEGYNPTFAEGLISPLNNAVEAYQKVFETIREPMKNVASMVEHIRPQIEAISKIQFPTLPTLPTMPSSFYDEDDEFTLPALTRPIQEVYIVNPEDIAITPTRQVHKYVIASYQLPGNAQWESLEIQFVDGHFVKVSYPKMESKKFDFKDMGFLNTKTNCPDLKWKLLKEMADNGGALTSGKWDRLYGRNVKYELNERLKEFFGMKENPIPHYTKKNGYWAKFTLRGDR